MPRVKFKTLTEQMYYILLCLTKECCGIDIMDKVSAMTAGQVNVGSGTLYNLLEQFQEAGMIRETKANIGENDPWIPKLRIRYEEALSDLLPEPLLQIHRPSLPYLLLKPLLQIHRRLLLYLPLLRLFLPKQFPAISQRPLSNLPLRVPLFLQKR